MNRRNLLLTGAAAVGALAGGARAQSDNTLRLIVPYAPGGSSDRAARIVADKLTARLGGPVVVENKTGAGGRLAMQQTKGLPASQNVLVLANPATMVVAPLVFKDNGYDPDKDFQPVSQVSDYEFGVAVATAVPVKEIRHLLAWLRANPSQANFGTLLPQHEAGKLRILASSGARRSPFAPNVPTFKESGLDLAASGWNAFFAPASMPADRVARLGSAIREVMQDEDTRRKFFDAKMVPVASTPAQTAAMLKAFRAQWAPVVQKSGYQP